MLAVIHWQLYTRKIGAEFQAPYRVAGLGLIVIPILVSLTPWNFSEWDSVIILSIATAVYMIEAWVKKNLRFGYLGVGFTVVTIWSVLATLGVEEMQAYIFPLGFALVGIGWYQRARVNDQFYQLVTIIGLGVFFASSFYQSRGEGASIWPNLFYAWLLTGEAVIAVAWGVRQKSRGYVQFGGLALMTNVIVQLGPAFFALGSWVKIGSIGSVLLIMGLVALFKREEVLETRQNMTEEWRSWNS